MSTPDITLFSGPQAGRRRRFSLDEKRRFLQEAERDNETVSSVGRRYGLSVSLLFRWRRQLGEPSPRAASDRAKPAEGVETRLREQVRDLQRLLGKKTLENESLREEIRVLTGKGGGATGDAFAQHHQNGRA